MGRVSRRSHGTKYNLPAAKTDWQAPPEGYAKEAEGMYFRNARGAFGGVPLGLSEREPIQKQIFDVVDSKLGAACGSVELAITREITRGSGWIATFVDWLLFSPGKPLATHTHAMPGTSLDMTLESLGVAHKRISLTRQG